MQCLNRQVCAAFLHITAVDVIKQGNNLLGVITESKSGRQAILANVIIDCTGDADIAWFAGAPFTKREREELMCMTTVFSCANINKNAFMQNIKSTEPKYGDWGRMKKIKTGLMMFMNLVAICLALIWVKSLRKESRQELFQKM